MKTKPFWWEEAEPAHGERAFDSRSFAVVIIGSGYAGLSAAITLAEAGIKDVAVVDAMRIGEGASSRNGGQIGSGAKFSLEQAARRFGQQRAREILDDYDQAMPFMLQRAATLAEDFDLNLCGSVSGAHSHKDLRAFRDYRDGLAPDKRKHIDVLDAREMQGVLKTDIYRGALVKHDTGSVHPAKYVRALANRARALGVRLFTGFRFQGASRGTSRFEVRLQDVDSRAEVRLSADKVLMAANGYVGPEMPWLRQRTIPVQSYMIATEPLPFDQLEELMPGNRVAGDTKHILYYFRRSPDGRRPRDHRGGAQRHHEPAPQPGGASYAPMATARFPPAAPHCSAAASPLAHKRRLPETPRPGRQTRPLVTERLRHPGRSAIKAHGFSAAHGFRRVGL